MSVTGEALGETGRKPPQRIGLVDMGVVGTGRRAHLEPVKTAAGENNGPSRVSPLTDN